MHRSACCNCIWGLRASHTTTQQFCFKKYYYWKKSKGTSEIFLDRNMGRISLRFFFQILVAHICSISCVLSLMELSLAFQVSAKLVQSILYILLNLLINSTVKSYLPTNFFSTFKTVTVSKYAHLISKVDCTTSWLSRSWKKKSKFWHSVAEKKSSCKRGLP